MGKLYKRGETWYADYFDRSGHRHRESTRTSDVRVARARLRDLELQTTDQRAHETEDVTAAIDYFVNVAHAASPAGTVRCYRQKGRHLTRLIGCDMLDRLTTERVERYVAERITEGAHPHSIHKELVVLRGALKRAAARDRFHGSLALVPRFDAAYEPRRTYLTPEQFERLVDHLVPQARAGASERTLAAHEQRKLERAFYCALIALASPRRGELEATEWPAVDLRRRVLQLARGKTVSRPIAIHDMLVPWLEAFGERAGWTGPLVAPWSNVGRDLPAACARAGVPRCTPNDLRRTFASWLVQRGVSLYVVSRLLGHKSTRMAELVYGQLDEASLAGAIGTLPWSCDAGVSRAVPLPGTAGAGGTSASPTTITNSVENSFGSGTSEVPRVGIEPTTRGFSVLTEEVAKLAPPRRKLRLVG